MLFFFWVIICVHTKFVSLNFVRDRATDKICNLTNFDRFLNIRVTLEYRLILKDQSWIFKYVAVTVAVAVALVVAVVVAVAVAVASASAANKTWIFKCLKFYVLLFFFLHMIAKNLSGCDLKI